MNRWRQLSLQDSIGGSTTWASGVKFAVSNKGQRAFAAAVYASGTPTGLVLEVKVGVPFVSGSGSAVTGVSYSTAKTATFGGGDTEAVIVLEDVAPMYVVELTTIPGGTTDIELWVSEP